MDTLLFQKVTLIFKAKNVLLDYVNVSIPARCYLIGEAWVCGTEIFLYYFLHACMLSRFSHVQLFATLWTAARQAPLSMGFSRQECWSGLPYPPPGGCPNPEIEPRSPVSPALAGGFLTTVGTWEAGCVGLPDTVRASMKTRLVSICISRKWEL